MSYVICEQQGRRSACASAQSDQRLVVCCLDSIISLYATAKISRLYLASVAAQAGLYLAWSETTRDTFCRRGARWLSGRVSDSGAKGRGFETYLRRIVFLSKTLYSPKVLVKYPGSSGSVPT